MFTLHNIQDGDEVYQRCVLVSGHVNSFAEEGHVSIETRSASGNPVFPAQQWPVCRGTFKALLMLTPGENTVMLSPSHVADINTPVSTGMGTSSASYACTNPCPDESSVRRLNLLQKFHIRLRYIPLLQAPPLHLAILVAKDSPLLIDCPPAKHGAVSSAHSSLDAAIAKFRMTAYMWQALTAEEFRAQGLGRRSFRLEEEWTTDTLSRAYAYADTPTNKACSTAKIHLVRCDRTVAELRDAQRAQQNPQAHSANALHEIFTAALKAHGAPFTPETCPVVAGLILDSHFDAAQGLIVAHAALGAHDPTGLSLGIFGSHLTYAWPRFVEEVVDCLSDTRTPGSTVGNDNGECVSLWETCAVGQGAFLHEVGHAFSAPHTTGIMARGYSPDWPKCFLSKTAYCVRRKADGGPTAGLGHDCHWDVKDLLRFRALPHFALPHDSEMSTDAPTFELRDDDDFPGIQITCEAGIAQVLLGNAVEPVASPTAPVTKVHFQLAELEGRFDPKEPLELTVVAMNGKHRSTDLWKLATSSSYVRVPGTNIRLRKKSAGNGGGIDEYWQKEAWPWAVMLKKRDRHGNLISASKIDIRVGCSFDGAEVYYRDGTKIPCGPRGKNGDDPHMGGHQAKKIALRKAEVAKVALSGEGGWLQGMRLWLSDGRAMGALNNRSNGKVEVLGTATEAISILPR
jgi:hypothetical protein